MELLVGNHGYGLYNFGDIAMLQVSLPEATVNVFADDPERLEELCPGTVAVSPQHFHELSAIAGFPARIKALEIPIRRHAPWLVDRLVDRRARRVAAESAIEGYRGLVRRNAALLVCGGGTLNDHFPGVASPFLYNVLAFQALGKPVGLFGQGLGPLQNPKLVALAKSALPRCEVIALRETNASGAVAGQLGVPDSVIRSTGDDAIDRFQCACLPLFEPRFRRRCRLGRRACEDGAEGRRYPHLKGRARR
jgi:colanic acid/amylovoran biosynthesis protein